MNVGETIVFKGVEVIAAHNESGSCKGCEFF